MNIVLLTGRIGKEPELKSLSSGKSVTSFSLAVDDGYKENKKTYWFQIEAWDKTAEAINRLSGKGKKILIEGRLSEDVWEQNGETKHRTKIVASRVEFLEFREDRVQGDGYTPAPITDDDIPF